MDIIKYTKIRKFAKLSKQHKGDIGYDISATLECESITIESGQWVVINTGIRLFLPPNIHAQIRPRSGLAKEHGITILNSPGSIDSGYNGEVKVILINHGPRMIINNGDRIAQVIFERHLPITITEIPETDIPKIDFDSRGSQGFGSTGISC